MHQGGRQFSVAARFDACATTQSGIPDLGEDFSLLGSVEQDPARRGWFNRLGVRRQPEASSTPSGKPHYQILGHPDFYEYLKQLRASNRSEEQELVRLIDKAIEVLQERATAGESIPRDRWPRTGKYEGIPNLYRYRLNRIQRLTYFIAKRGNHFVVNIIEAMDHTRYNRIFGYD